jgi:hypothetical protein
MDFEKLVIEGQEFLKLRMKHQKDDNPSNGTVGYLISVKWVAAYKKYVCYEELKNNRKPTPHNEPAPGKISNSDFLETDTSYYLPGSGTN